MAFQGPFSLRNVLRSPNLLYHGTSRLRFERISKEGLLPYLDSHTGRLFGILLTTEPDDAWIWAGVKARDDESERAILQVDTDCAQVPFRRVILSGFTGTEDTFGGEWYMTRFQINPGCITLYKVGS